MEQRGEVASELSLVSNEWWNLATLNGYKFFYVHENS
jgi:hypothetical protein